MKDFVENKGHGYCLELYDNDLQSFRVSLEFLVYIDNFLLDFNTILPSWGAI